MSYQRQPLAQHNENEFDELVEKTQLARLQKDVSRLERLYSEQVIANQAINEDQERLEIELLKKEKEIFKQQVKLKELTETNRDLSKKLSGDLAYYERELINYKHLEKEWERKYTEFSRDKKKYDAETKAKDAEIERLNNDIHNVLNDLDAKSLEITKLKVELNTLWTSEDSTATSDDEQNGLSSELQLVNDSEDELIDESLIHTDSENDLEDLKESSFSLANEMSEQLDEREKKVKTYEFETNSLKNENKQLYDYINRLLRNRPHPQQNAVLKKKLVDRKILRSISTNASHQDTLQAPKPRAKKRAVSNYVLLKNYNFQTPITHNSNSDDESEELKDEIAMMNRPRVPLGHRLLRFKDTVLEVSVTSFFIKAKSERDETHEGDDYEEHALLEIE